MTGGFYPVTRTRDVRENGDHTFTWRQFLENDYRYFQNENGELNTLDIEYVESLEGNTGPIRLREKGVVSVGVRNDGEAEKYLGLRPDETQKTGAEQLEFTPVEMVLDNAVFPLTIAGPAPVDPTTDDCGDVVVKHHKNYNRQMVKVRVAANDFQVKFNLNLKGLRVKNPEVAAPYEIRAGVPRGSIHRMGNTTAAEWQVVKDGVIASGEPGVIHGVFTDKTISTNLESVFGTDLTGLPEGYTSFPVPDFSCRSWPNKGQYALSIYNAPVGVDVVGEMVRQALSDMTAQNVVLNTAFNGAHQFLLDGKIMAGAASSPDGDCYTVMVFIGDVSFFLPFYREGKALDFPLHILSDTTLPDLERAFAPYLDHLVVADTRIMSGADGVYYEEDEHGGFEIVDAAGGFKFRIKRPVLLDHDMNVLPLGTRHALRKLPDGAFEYVKYPDPVTVLGGGARKAAYIDAYTCYTSAAYDGVVAAGGGSVSAAWNEPLSITLDDPSQQIWVASSFDDNKKMNIKTWLNNRGLIPFNTAGIPDDHTLTSAVFHFKTMAGNWLAPQREWYIYKGTYGLPSTKNDFNNCTGSYTQTITGYQAEKWHALTLNAASRAIISFTGWTKFMLKSRADATNNANIMDGAEGAIYASESGNAAYLTITTQPPPSTVTFSTDGNGTISGANPQAVTHGGNAAAVTAVPHPGYRFTGWTGSVTSSANPLTVGNVTGDMAVQANFELDVVAVNFGVAGPGGMISGDLNQVIHTGGNTSILKAIPYLNYAFEGWQGDHTGRENPLTITNVQAAMDIQAKFRCLMQVVESI